ncbi:response regulator [Lacibacter luteus]|uniref:histidine kinase n=2 Tax=Lacibacter luteus TaxID=2508719 RepID=A0A4Q1CNY0_9BACT|nr:response regulator [Lacibacter luteus]
MFLLLLVCCFTACKTEKEKEYVIGFSQCGDADNWRKAMIGEMRRELAFNPNFRLLYKQADDNSAVQIKQVKELLKENIDLLIISPNEAAPLTPIVEEVYNKGIPVIVVDRKIASQLYNNYIGADNYEIGKIAGNYAASLLGESGNIVEIGGLPASSPAIERRKGFADALASHKNIKVVKQVNGNWVKPIAKDALLKVIDNVTTPSLVFAHNDVMALGAYEVFKEKQLPPVKIIGVDALPGKGAGMEYVNNGIITASVLYPTGGAESIRNAVSLLNNQPVPKETVLQTLIVDSANVRMTSLQADKILEQQKDIEQQQIVMDKQQQTYQTQRNLLYVLGITLALTFCFAGLLFYSRQVNRRMNKQLAQKNEEVQKKSEQLMEMSAKAEVAHEARLNFFTNISHEFRTPLSLILGPVEELLDFSKLPPSTKQPLQLIQKNTQRLLRLVNQLIDFRKIEFNKMQVKATETDLVLFVNEIIQTFQPIAEKRDIDCRLITQERALYIWADQGMLDKILFNLLSNAFKFTAEGGFITVSLEKDPVAACAIIKVEDNGRGMLPEEMNQVFDIFYQGDYGSHKGSGLGLPLTKELIALHHGSITVSSQKSKGSVFTVRLPLGKEHFTETELSLANDIQKFSSEEEEIFMSDLYSDDLFIPGNEESKKEKLGAIVIVEDNPEMRKFLRQRLSETYYVYEAENGAKGLQIVFDQMPDLVISDVMMPVKDGFTLTEELKKDIRTSHIPVILLTAKTSAQQQMTGLEIAADAYVAKPFNFSILEKNISSLLANRKKIKSHYSSEIPVELKSSGKITDRRLVADFISIIERNISNENLSVDDICKELNLSKIQLHRKIKSLMDTNINEYVLNTRIQKAKYYLQHEELSVAEVAYKTGFSTAAYFSTVFKNKTGLTPKAFKEKGSA